MSYSAQVCRELLDERATTDPDPEESARAVGVKRMDHRYRRRYNEHPGKWRASVPIKGRHVVIGFFGTKEAAIKARRKAMARRRFDS